ncbi:MAG: glycoside hydrolase family 65 protein [Alkaliphilus sp.]
MKAFNNNTLLVEESLYTTANGYIGVRGNFEEGYESGFETIKGTYINGFYDCHSISYPESAYGFPVVGETMVQVTEIQDLEFIIDGDKFSMNSGEYTLLSRNLDLKTGENKRSIHWVSPKGHKLTFEFSRMAHLNHLQTFIIKVEITSHNYYGKVQFRSFVNHNFQIRKDSEDPRVQTEHIEPIEWVCSDIDDQRVSMLSRTKKNKQHLNVFCQHNISGKWSKEPLILLFESIFELTPNQTYEIHKYGVYTVENRQEDYVSAGLNQLNQVITKGYSVLLKEQSEHLKIFWNHCEIEIFNEENLTDAIKYSQYQLLAASGKDGLSQVSAKGLTGAGYEGHYFWDTEIYVVPFLTLSAPELARKILRYRHNTISEAKERSLKLGHSRGAKIPWRTISGIECSSYFPAGTAQYHINADVAYGYLQYYFMTKDDEMMLEFGYEVLYETALLWLEVGHYHNEEFCIDGVTGPDEYTTIVNNNYYTNAMAKYHLYWTWYFYEKFGASKYNSNTVLAMKEASEKMRLPYDEKLKIHKQDDQFLTKKLWDFENVEKTKYPLLLNFHPLAIYRHQVLKQADTVLAHFLLDEKDKTVLKNSYDYYEKITTHDSSLSPCVYGMMACKINDLEKAYNYFMKSVYLDLDNLHGNTKDGLHIANAGGTYMGIVYGFGGLRISHEGISLNPTLPKNWTGYSFKFINEGITIKVTVKDKVIIKSTKPVKLKLFKQWHEITDVLEVILNEKN